MCIRDRLSGVLGAFLGMGMARLTAMEAAVCVHAEAGELEALDHGEWGMAAGELCDSIRAVINGRSAPVGGWRLASSFSGEGDDGEA